MTAVAILARAEAAGVRVSCLNGKLKLAAASPPAPELLHALAGEKAALLELLAEREATAAERVAIMAEPSLPPPGTTERERADRRQAETVAGLLRQASRGNH